MANVESATKCVGTNNTDSTSKCLNNTFANVSRTTVGQNTLSTITTLRSFGLTRACLQYKQMQKKILLLHLEKMVDKLECLLEKQNLYEIDNLIVEIDFGFVGKHRLLVG